jgi:hypothetical protein
MNRTYIILYLLTRLESIKQTNVGRTLCVRGREGVQEEELFWTHRGIVRLWPCFRLCLAFSLSKFSGGFPFPRYMLALVLNGRWVYDYMVELA